MLNRGVLSVAAGVLGAAVVLGGVVDAVEEVSDRDVALVRCGVVGSGSFSGCVRLFGGKAGHVDFVAGVYDPELFLALGVVLVFLVGEFPVDFSEEPC